jgi:hypothetical protein
MPSRPSKLLLTLIAACAACAPQAVQSPAATAPLATSTALPASLPTASATPTAPAAASPTALHPAPRLFSESFDGPAPYWTYEQAGNGQPMAAPQIRDGFLVFDLAAPNQWAYAIYGGPDTADVSIQAQVQDRTGGDGAAGVVCRYDKVGGWYELEVFADGTYELLYGRWLTTGVAGYTPLYRGESAAVGAQENAIGLECRGNSLTPSVNGQPLRKWQELKFGLKQGKVGVSASSFADVPLAIAFDSVKVSEP